METCVRIDFDGRAVWMCHECRGGNVRNYDFAGGKASDVLKGEASVRGKPVAVGRSP